MLLSEENLYFIVKDITAKSLIHDTFLDNFVKSGTVKQFYIILLLLQYVTE